MASNKPKIVTVGPSSNWAGNPKGRLSGKAPSSTRQSKATGITPGKTRYGILVGGNNSGEKLRAKASRLFRTGGRNIPNGQARLSGKAKRQVQ